MKELSISVQTAGWLNPLFGEGRADEAFEFIKKCGFESLDYNIDTKLVPKQIDKNDKGTFFIKSTDEILEYYAPMKEALDKTGITLTQAHAPFPLFRRSSEEMSDFLIEALEKCLAACKFLGIPAIVTHPCNYLDRENEKRCNLALFRRIMPIAKEYGVKICLENVPNVQAGHVVSGTCCDVNEAIEYIDTFNEEAGEDIFGFCFDIGHANISSTNVYDYLKKMGHRLTVLHLHDNDAVSDQHLAPMTQRKTDWDGLIMGLRDINYRGPINFEACKSIMNYPKELIPAMLTYTAEVGKYIRTKILEG
ncbi:MAG: sugar phosphate isomerase/epimerase [Clostridia bacterium]|nr:sugar phosphate isomerase/epimerase [Clostridia bacterium]MBQ6614523.1 sugar phosphate isomerase/epimerase [Clostridia bacterium]